jgi:hypothetical protein
MGAHHQPARAHGVAGSRHAASRSLGVQAGINLREEDGELRFDYAFGLLVLQAS